MLMAQKEQESAEVSPDTLRGWLDHNQAILIDVREPDEHAREHIRGSRLLPLSRFDPAAVPGADGKHLVVHCKSGRRAAEAAARLNAAGRREVRNLKGGIDAWKSAGLPIEANAKLPISIMRQVQVVVGTAVLVGSVLSATVSPWFLVLTGFFGAGRREPAPWPRCSAPCLGTEPSDRAPSAESIRTDDAAPRPVNVRTSRSFHPRGRAPRLMSRLLRWLHPRERRNLGDRAAS
jgi:rhodanese-related sulfurtransferase